MTLLERLVAGQLWNPNTWMGAIAYLIFFIVGAALLARLVQSMIQQTLKRDAHGLVDKTAAPFLLPLSKIAVYVIFLTIYAHIIPALRSLGTALLTGASVSAVVIGLAAQNTLGNLIAGLALLLYRPFKVEDRLQINAPAGIETGTVESITLGYTVLQTFDNRRVVVPNSIMANQISINLTRLSPRVMAVVPISIGYGANLDQARQIVLEIAQAHPQVKEVVNCPVVQLGNSSVNLSLRVWCDDPVAAKQVEYDLYEQTKKRFDEAKIEIPFPYTNIIIRQNDTHGD